MTEKTSFAKNVIIINADYVDRVALNLIVNFERMLNRPIAAADIPRWLNCLALDCGINIGENEIQIIFIHSKEKKCFKNFIPNDFEKDLDAKAFKDHLGEFLLNSFAVENIVSLEQFYQQVLETVLNDKQTQNIAIIDDLESGAEHIKQIIKPFSKQKDLTVFSMEPLYIKGTENVILGYSLMNAMGVKGEEFT